VILIIAIISLLAAAVFAPNTEVSRGYIGLAAVLLGTAVNHTILAGAAITAPGSTIYGKTGA